MGAMYLLFHDDRTLFGYRSTRETRPFLALRSGRVTKMQRIAKHERKQNGTEVTGKRNQMGNVFFYLYCTYEGMVWARSFMVTLFRNGWT